MCVASGKCKNCDADVSDIATVTYAVKKAPTCLNAGTGTYTATFSAAYGFPAQTKDVLLPAIGHTWGTATYNMDADRNRLYLYREARLQE